MRGHSPGEYTDVVREGDSRAEGGTQTGVTDSPTIPTPPQASNALREGKVNG